MKQNVTKILLLFIGILIGIAASGQIAPGWIPKKSYVDAARSAVQEKDYFSALNHYLEALQYDSTDVAVLYEAAETARAFASFNLAAQLYEKALDIDGNDDYYKAGFWLAAMWQRQGKYDEAITQYTTYISEYEERDEYLTNRARKEISSCEWSKVIMNNPIENMQLIREGDQINTPDSEFGGVLEPNGLTFSSLKNYDRAERIPLKPYSRIYSIAGDAPPVEYDEVLSKEGFLTAHTAYNINRSRIYYTVCTYLNMSEITCDIAYRPILGDGTLGSEIILDSIINMPGFTSTQPNIGFDNRLNKEVLYFVSDRPEPFGNTGSPNKDLNIWYSTIESAGSYGTPIFLERINTPEDDITPFFHSNSQVLYFSSEGYTGLGGFDVYRSSRNNQGVWNTPENMGVPVNSSNDDIYYTLNKEGDKGLMSSNRDSTRYVPVSLKARYLIEESESCCFDIYQVSVGDLEINLIALTFDSRTLDSLTGVRVDLIDPSTGELLTTVTNDIGAEHLFQLERSKEYMIVSSKDKYLTDTTLLNTKAVYQSGDIVRKIYLQKKVLDLQALTFDKISRSPLVGTTVSVVDLTDSTLIHNPKTNQAGNDFYFELIPGHRYRLTGSKDRYYDDVIEFVANDEDGSGLLVKRLFLDRRDLNIYLPLAVYFDNDLPDRRTMSLNTNVTYTQTFDEYVFKKQEFKDNYSNGLSGSEKQRAEQAIEQFFQNDLNGGFDRLQQFLDAMLVQLENGKEFDLSIRGYTSPRADSRYNLALGQRRVKAMRNEMMMFKDGALQRYVESGQLKITELSYGENLVPPGVADSYVDRKNSIYSPEASRERRAEIVEIKTQNTENNN